jgi:hypothetical protein
MGMIRTIRIVGLFCIVSAATFADTWTGFLVDSPCYQAEERNVNPTDTLTSVDRDRNSEMRRCAPARKTKAFAVVQSNGPSLQLDSAGNRKADELVRQAGKQERIYVTVTGEMTKNTVRVDSITMGKQVAK